MKVRRLGVLANFRKAEIREILTSIIELFPDETTIVGQEKTANLLPAGKIEKVDSFEGCDTVLALGGDGTLLRAARRSGPWKNCSKAASFFRSGCAWMSL